MKQGDGDGGDSVGEGLGAVGRQREVHRVRVLERQDGDGRRLRVGRRTRRDEADDGDDGRREQRLRRLLEAAGPAWKVKTPSVYAESKLTVDGDVINTGY